MGIGCWGMRALRSFKGVLRRAEVVVGGGEGGGGLPGG